LLLTGRGAQAAPIHCGWQGLEGPSMPAGGVRRYLDARFRRVSQHRFRAATGEASGPP